MLNIISSSIKMTSPIIMGFCLTYSLQLAQMARQQGL